MNALALGLAGLIAGAIIGSFLATLCYRWPNGKSVLRGRSRCDGCAKVLSARDLVPLLSAPLAGHKARCCGHPIDPLHGRVEWLAAFIGASALIIGGPIEGAALALFGWLLLPLAVLDARHFWLPDILVGLVAVAGLAAGGLLVDEPLSVRLLTGLAAGAGLALIGAAYRALRKRDGLGAGDPKLLGAIGFWLGPQLTIAALLAAAVIGLGEAVVRRRAMDEARPFGTLLAIGAWLVGLTTKLNQ